MEAWVPCPFQEAVVAAVEVVGFTLKGRCDVQCIQCFDASPDVGLCALFRGIREFNKSEGIRQQVQAVGAACREFDAAQFKE